MPDHKNTGPQIQKNCLTLYFTATLYVNWRITTYTEVLNIKT